MLGQIGTSYEEDMTEHHMVPFNCWYQKSFIFLQV